MLLGGCNTLSTLASQISETPLPPQVAAKRYGVCADCHREGVVPRCSKCIVVQQNRRILAATPARKITPEMRVAANEERAEGRNCASGCRPRRNPRRGRRAHRLPKTRVPTAKQFPSRSRSSGGTQGPAIFRPAGLQPRHHRSGPANRPHRNMGLVFRRCPNRCRLRVECDSRPIGGAQTGRKAMNNPAKCRAPLQPLKENSLYIVNP